MAALMDRYGDKWAFAIAKRFEVDVEMLDFGGKAHIDLEAA